MKRALGLVLAALLVGSTADVRTAAAADYDDLDSPEEDDGKKKKKRKRRDYADQDVREIVKGWYAKSNIGGWIYVGQFRNWVNPGTSLALAIGQDFVDNERNSMAWEIAFFQGIHNGTSWELQDCAEAPCVEGDLRTYSGAATLEYSAYISRRFGVGLRAGGGVLYSPLLIYEDAYYSDVISDWGVEDPGYHDLPHPMVIGGPTFEYYTKMAHFSMGADVDAIYAIGFDFGVSITGTLKYTF